MYFLLHEITSVEIEIVVVSHVLWLVYGGFGGFMAGLFIVGPIDPYMVQVVFLWFITAQRIVNSSSILIDDGFYQSMVKDKIKTPTQIELPVCLLKKVGKLSLPTFLNHEKEEGKIMHLTEGQVIF